MVNHEVIPRSEQLLANVTDIDVEIIPEVVSELEEDLQGEICGIFGVVEKYDNLDILMFKLKWNTGKSQQQIVKGLYGAVSIPCLVVCNVYHEIIGHTSLRHVFSVYMLNI